MARVTRADVARLAGVSTAVVSYVLNDGPRSVAPETRQRVLDAVAALKYRPDRVARALRARKTHILGLVIPDSSNPFFAELSRAVEDAAFERGYALLIGNSNELPERETAYINTFHEHQVDALLLISVQASTISSLLPHPHIPVVMLDRLEPDAGISGVATDNEAGAIVGTQHLLSHGHASIACIAGPVGVDSADRRVDGWRAALVAAGISIDESLLVRTSFSRQGGYDAARFLLDREDVPTAIFASSDLQGVGALRAASELGVSVPGGLAIVAFDGTEEARFTVPGLSSLRQRTSELASAAVARAVSLLAEGASGEEPGWMPEEFELELTPRGSCGCPDPSASAYGHRAASVEASVQD